MKVYLTASTENIKENPEVFEKVVRYIQARGDSNTNLYLQHLLTDKSFQNGDKDIYSKTLSVVGKSDLLIAEVSYPSISLGFLIEKAINLSIPVICLCQEKLSKNISTILKRYKSSTFKILKYNNSNIEAVLGKELSNFKKHKVKLNVFLEAKLDNYLKLKSKNKGITKSQYLRDMIIEKMKKENGD